MLSYHPLLDSFFLVLVFGLQGDSSTFTYNFTFVSVAASLVRSHYYLLAYSLSLSHFFWSSMTLSVLFWCVDLRCWIDHTYSAMGDSKTNVQDQDLSNWDYLLLRILGGLLRADLRPLHDSFHSWTNNLFVLILENCYSFLCYFVTHTHYTYKHSWLIGCCWSTGLHRLQYSSSGVPRSKRLEGIRDYKEMLIDFDCVGGLVGKWKSWMWIRDTWWSESSRAANWFSVWCLDSTSSLLHHPQRHLERERDIHTHKEAKLWVNTLKLRNG